MGNLPGLRACEPSHAVAALCAAILCRRRWHGRLPAVLLGILLRLRERGDMC